MPTILISHVSDVKQIRSCLTVSWDFWTTERKFNNWLEREAATRKVFLQYSCLLPNLWRKSVSKGIWGNLIQDNLDPIIKQSVKKWMRDNSDSFYVAECWLKLNWIFIPFKTYPSLAAIHSLIFPFCPIYKVTVMKNHTWTKSAFTLWFPEKESPRSLPSHRSSGLGIQLAHPVPYRAEMVAKQCCILLGSKFPSSRACKRHQS